MCVMDVKVRFEGGLSVHVMAVMDVDKYDMAG